MLVALRFGHPSMKLLAAILLLPLSVFAQLNPDGTTHNTITIANCTTNYVMVVDMVSPSIVYFSVPGNTTVTLPSFGQFAQADGIEVEMQVGRTGGSFTALVMANGSYYFPLQYWPAYSVTCVARMNTYPVFYQNTIASQDASRDYTVFWIAGFGSVLVLVGFGWTMRIMRNVAGSDGI